MSRRKVKKPSKYEEFDYSMRCGSCNHKWWSNEITVCPKCEFKHILVNDHRRLLSVYPFEVGVDELRLVI